MAKKSCWFGWVKRFFVHEATTKTEKRTKRFKWDIGRFKLRQQLALKVPKRRTFSEATEEQKKHALAVAIATAAAAEAAVAAAQAAAEVVRLTTDSQSYHLSTKVDQNLAAVGIQSAFRSYLARKALRALKGLVRLQALIRGQNVRRKAARLRYLNPAEKFSFKVQLKNTQLAGDGTNGENEEKKSFRCLKENSGEKEIKLECNTPPRGRDRTALSNKSMEATWLRKQDAVFKREKMMKYSFSSRERRNNEMLEEAFSRMGSCRKGRWPDQWSDFEAYNGEACEGLTRTISSNRSSTEIFDFAQIKQMSTPKLNSIGFPDSPHSLSRRSFCCTKKSNIAGDGESSASSSPKFPTYMAATQSALAKTRSASTPRQRIKNHDSYVKTRLRQNEELSSLSSYGGESFSPNTKSDSCKQILV